MQTLLDATPREKSTVGGVAMWSGQFVKAWSTDCGSPGVEQRRIRMGSGVEGSNGRNGTAVKFRTTSVCVAMWQSNLTQPQQSGWSTGSHWDKSDIWLLETCGYNNHARSGKIRVSQNVRAGQSARCTNQVSWARTTVAPHENVQLGPCR